MIMGAALGSFLVVCGTLQDPRTPLPSEEAQGKAEKEIRSIFKDDYAVKSNAAQRKLAKLFLDQGRETRDEPALRYALFREAADLALHSGDVDVLLGSLDAECKDFAVDAPNLRATSLLKAESAVTAPEDFKKLTQALLDLTRDAVGLEEFDLASKTVQASLSSAKKAKDITIASLAEVAIKSVLEIKGAFEKAKKAEVALKMNPEDSQANQSLGEYLSLSKNDWEKGLVFLAKGSDPVLKALAAKELAAPAELPVRIEVADGWWDLGTSEKSAIRKASLLGHARSLYEDELPNASGLLRAKLEARLAQKSPSGLLPTAPPRINRAGLVAWWKCDEGKGTSVANSAGPGNVATLMNGMDWVPGRLGKALQFDGKKGYLSCSAENLPATNASQTLSFWIKLSSRSTRGEDLLCFSNDACTGALQAGVSAKNLAFWKFGGGALGTAAPPGADAWHHYAFVSDGKTHFVYMDGKPESKVATPPQAVPVTKCEFGRYRGPGGEDRYFSGALDEIRIYSRALTETEVQGLATGNE